MVNVVVNAMKGNQLKCKHCKKIFPNHLKGFNDKVFHELIHDVSMPKKKVFEHVDIKYELPELKRKNLDGRRVYVDEEGNQYESTTNVVGFRDKQGLQKWRDAVGEDVANYVSGKAMGIGTKMHNTIELYLNNLPLVETNLLANAHFNNIKKLVNNISNIIGVETRLCSKELGLAGTADCIAEYDGKKSIIDFKTSSKQKKEEWIQKYFLQTTAYSLMWEELTGEKIEQIVILITGEDGSRDTFIRNRNDYIEELHNTIEAFKLDKEQNG